MTTVVIFWTAIIAGLFFLIGTVFKGLVAAVNALLSTFGQFLVVGGISGAVALVLYLLHAIVQAVVAGKFWGIVGGIVLIAVLAGGLIAAVCGLGFAVLELAAVIAAYAVGAVWLVLEGLTSMCDKIYYYFLRIIDNQLKKS